LKSCNPEILFKVSGGRLQQQSQVDYLTKGQRPKTLETQCQPQNAFITTILI